MSGKDVFRKGLLFAVQHARLVAAALIVAGYIAVPLLPFMARPTFFDENALMVNNSVPSIGLPAPGRPGSFVSDAIASIKNDIRHHPVATILSRQGLQVQQQHFASADGSRSCVNNYVVVPSVRGDGSEGLSLVTPVSLHCPPASPHAWQAHTEPCWNQSIGAATAMLASGTVLTKHLQNVSWLARDFVWLIPDASCGLVHSTQAWSNLAMGPDALTAAHQGLSVKAGRLQQAVIVEAQQARWKGVEVSAVGRQGLLPKLDVVLLVNHFFGSHLKLRTQLPQRTPALLERLRAASPAPQDKKQKQYAQLLQGTLSFMAMQVGGVPDGAHAAFKDYAVDAVTARMVVAEGGHGTSDEAVPQQVIRLAAAVEGTMRSCNNLLERLHHSYFMYLLPSMNKFIPIEGYTLPPALILLGLFLLAANSCLQLGPDNHQCKKPSSNPSNRCAEDAEPSGLDAGGGPRSSTKAQATPKAHVYPQHAVRPVLIRGGWPALSQSCCKVAAVHAIAAATGWVVHVCYCAMHEGTGAHKVRVSSWPEVSLGAASAAGMISLLVNQGFCRASASEDAAKMDYAVSLLSTVVLMAAWMFVNWADVYVALLCSIPVAVIRKGSKPRTKIWVLLGGLAWIVFNPWTFMAQEDVLGTGSSALHWGTWLFRLSLTSQAFVWLVYVPTWSKGWV